MAEYKCPACGNYISDDDALLCHFCGESLERAGNGFLSRIRYANRKVVWFFIVFIVVLVFLLVSIR
ncbi:MAG TPA: hypothetical protein PL155_02430 [Candidatus Omnitrophota bacterium]|nr:hypothetical protein [Candidatus Omnitrophota bacterium]HPD84658.1 hypothetical protein [Candidatus Omnitrophota bacterium]HRZ03516.1 hypothetical protein [Candidatus Omnitrophota bacterium]